MLPRYSRPCLPVRIAGGGPAQQYAVDPGLPAGTDTGRAGTKKAGTLRPRLFPA